MFFKGGDQSEPTKKFPRYATLIVDPSRLPITLQMQDTNSTAFYQKINTELGTFFYNARALLRLSKLYLHYTNWLIGLNLIKESNSILMR